MAATRTAPPKHQPTSILPASRSFQRREWLLQRIGWAAISLVLVAGLSGLFGGGPLAGRTAANDGLAMEYEGLTRRGSPTTWTLTPRSAPANGRYEISLQAHWARHFRIHAIQPEPDSTRLEGSYWVYEFRARSAGTPITFHVEAENAGPFEGAIRLDDAAPLQVRQFVYP
jgi:hypothetical protein